MFVLLEWVVTLLDTNDRTIREVVPPEVVRSTIQGEPQCSAPGGCKMFPLQVRASSEDVREPWVCIHREHRNSDTSHGGFQWEFANCGPN
jgi:hypothetical protein